MRALDRRAEVINDITFHYHHILGYGEEGGRESGAEEGPRGFILQVLAVTLFVHDGVMVVFVIVIVIAGVVDHKHHIAAITAFLAADKLECQTEIISGVLKRSVEHDVQYRFVDFGSGVACNGEFIVIVIYQCHAGHRRRLNIPLGILDIRRVLSPHLDMLADGV